MSRKKIVFVGGGTGGHFYPLIAIAEAIQSEVTQKSIPAPELYYMGPEEYDTKALSDNAIQYIHCPAGKRRRYHSLLNFFDFFKTWYGLFVALFKLFLIYPDVVMSKGSFTSVPVVVAAWVLRIPIVIHESDATPGRANKLAAHFAQHIAVSYPDTLDTFPHEKTTFTGIPVRRVLTQEVHDLSLQAFGITENLPVILVLGGSQGAERVNKLILETLDELLPRFTIIHQTGKINFQIVSETSKALIKDPELLERYHPVPFIEASDLHVAMLASSIIISRAGSGSIYEIAHHGKPSIVIPIPEEISHDQRTNAYAYARSGATTVMEEKNLTDGLLEAEINRIMNDPHMYKAMSDAALSFGERNAAEKIAHTLLEIGESHS